MRPRAMGALMGMCSGKRDRTLDDPVARIWARPRNGSLGRLSQIPSLALFGSTNTRKKKSQAEKKILFPSLPWTSLCPGDSYPPFIYGMGSVLFVCNIFIFYLSVSHLSGDRLSSSGTASRGGRGRKETQHEDSLRERTRQISW